MIDGPSAIDPLVAEGPLAPVETLRPAVSLQRVLLLDQPGPLMADLATGDIRRWENGPPVSVPVISTATDLADLERLQVQVLRDPRPTSTNTVLLSLHLASPEGSIDVTETPDGRLRIASTRAGAGDQPDAPIGVSPAIVVVIEPAVDGTSVTVSARNAEALDPLQLTVPTRNLDNSVLTIGGPTTALTGAHGRRRSLPVHIDVTRRAAPIDQIQRAAKGARRVVGALRDRVT